MTLILKDKAALRAWRAALPAGQKLAFVATMGALHAGHVSLMEQARQAADLVIVSIFVNPLQFGPNEDLSRYPRPLEADLARLEAAGVDALFLPSVADMYPEGASTFVDESMVSLPLCGAERPGHFRGVATVVLKLFNLVQPHVALFGQKDAQQCAVIERMVRDLDVPVEIRRGAIVREADGLALSSRNIYLSPADRAEAPLIYQSLRAVEAAYRAGEHDAEKLAALGLAELAKSERIVPQYWEVRDPESLGVIAKVGSRGALLAVAAQLGTTRLIDNLLLVPAIAASADRLADC
ncbi:pantoate--beta-alanine ligase [Devosia sp. YIM 151766]|uniref:pantoate--beta-alanine ligase n=1 Tax=Devosia sp. YIM 151766 TaxID=3017325 RepID=UPI00255C81E8|nr:pantoate--beta-alanine ligase [Devosia sp. YIM 151766]WIY53139.1 pantoate--beta-alanine ligase [Devosia sp. YIM 151766]